MGKRSLQDASPVDLETACRDHADALRAITRKAREDEADLAQDACLRLVETAQRETVGAPAHLLYRIARNLVIDRMRGRGRAARLFQDQTAYEEHRCPSPDPERVLLATERLRRALKVIDAMPDRRREAFLLHRIDGLSYPQIARRMGVSVKGVEKHISSAMLQLLRGMQAEGFDD
ncbi:RNA polymerase sigma factor [Brevundimonas sp. P7753]|uniref:RNA polymerase sigma factor n=1 Tax=Brevundimonas sp. P7753 TaxID=2726982 RepID=UPI0015B9E81E|nr:RNA polymerase sigma factor [Brevundimonas sp. P7753]NWE53124.1 RNA polymerase sigma factor [Brevundimonas sp. P7753]